MDGRDFALDFSAVLNPHGLDFTKGAVTQTLFLLAAGLVHERVSLDDLEDNLSTTALGVFRQELIEAIREALDPPS